MSTLAPEENNMFWESLFSLLLGISFGVQLDTQLDYIWERMSMAAAFGHLDEDACNSFARELLDWMEEAAPIWAAGRASEGNNIFADVFRLEQIPLVGSLAGGSIHEGMHGQHALNNLLPWDAPYLEREDTTNNISEDRLGDILLLQVSAPMDFSIERICFFSAAGAVVGDHAEAQGPADGSHLPASCAPGNIGTPEAPGAAAEDAHP